MILARARRDAARAVAQSALGAWLAVAACNGEHDKAATPPPAATPPSRRTAPSKPPDLKPDKQVVPEPDTSAGPPARPHTNSRPARQPTTDAAAPEEDATERDLADELRRAVGTPTSCLRMPSRPTRVHIRISAMVTRVGRVTRAEVTAHALSDEERACVRELAERSRLPSPIEDAPRRIESEIVLEFEPRPQSP